MKQDYYVGGLTVGDLETLQEIKLEPGNTWKLIVPQHDIEEEFASGLLGKTGFQLLEVISKVYSKMEKVHPPTKETVEEDGETIEYEVHFWGDHAFLETINVDHDNKIVELHFGS